MHMLYNSDSFAVVRFDVPAGSQPLADPAAAGPASAAAGAPQGLPGRPGLAAPLLARGGFEIVDKFARKEIFIEGALAERFEQGVQALVDQGPTEEALDEFISGFTALAQQPLVLH